MKKKDEIRLEIMPLAYSKTRKTIFATISYHSRKKGFLRRENRTIYKKTLDKWVDW